jgi:phosphoribosylaminoimidazole (AIR) synthetase
VDRSGLTEAERYRVLNMGIGFVLVVRPEDAMTVMAELPGSLAIGRVIPRATTDETAVQGLFS